MLRVAVDVGGTFTDIVGVDDEGSNIFVLKIKSSPTNPEVAFVEGVKRLISENRLSPSNIANIIHVGTIGSNLFLGQLGIRIPKTGLVTTRGFRDVLEIGRQNRAELYNVFFERPKPLVSRKLRFEVQERTTSSGVILHGVDRDELELLAQRLKKSEVDSVAICFLNSYLNPENEKKAREALSKVSRFVFASYEIDPEHREFERTSTTVVNAVLAPVISQYLSSATEELRANEIDAPIQLLSSAGGLMDLESVRLRPVAAVESGPAAGVVGAAEVARILGRRRLLSLDMGGTTAKAGCVVDYTPLTVPEIEIGGRVHLGRAIKGSGYPVRYPSVDIAEVSAGGGTIIWSDEIGVLRVGPISAGALPGPACYGSGGQAPTITDANLILGRLGPKILGREMQLNTSLAIRSMEEVGGKVNMSATETAVASIRLVNLEMARALDIVSLERGQDPRTFSLMAFGGAGPMHAAELAEQLGISTVIVPPHPGLFSALGMTMTDMKYHYVRGILKRLDELPDDFFEETWNLMLQGAISDLKRFTGEATTKITSVRTADIRYLGQGFELVIQAPQPFNRQNLTESFEQKHEAVYGYRHTTEPLEITAMRLTITIPVSQTNLKQLAGMPQQVAQTHRAVWFNDGWHESSVHWRESMLPSARFDGPLIIEEYDSTTVVPPGWNCSSDENNCLVMEQES